MEIQSAETTPNSLVIPPFISPRDRLTTRDIFPSRFFKDLSIADLEDNRIASSAKNHRHSLATEKHTYGHRLSFSLFSFLAVVRRRNGVLITNLPRQERLICRAN